MSASWKWRLWDPWLNTTYILEINPNDQTDDTKRNFTTDVTAIAGGLPIIFEGRAAPKQITLKGSNVTQTQFVAIDGTWTKKPYQFMITDDLGRTTWVISQEWNPERKWKVNAAWFHDYTWTLLVVDWGNPPSFGVSPEGSTAPSAPTMAVQQVGDDGRGNGYVAVTYGGSGSPPLTFQVWAQEGLEPDTEVWSDQSPGQKVFMVPVGVHVTYHVTAVNADGSADSGTQSLTVS